MGASPKNLRLLVSSLRSTEVIPLSRFRCDEREVSQVLFQLGYIQNERAAHCKPSLPKGLIQGARPDAGALRLFPDAGALCFVLAHRQRVGEVSRPQLGGFQKFIFLVVRPSSPTEKGMTGDQDNHRLQTDS